jgi:hypothetical protein
MSRTVPTERITKSKTMLATDIQSNIGKALTKLFDDGNIEGVMAMMTSGAVSFVIAYRTICRWTDREYTLNTSSYKRDVTKEDITMEKIVAEIMTFLARHHPVAFATNDYAHYVYVAWANHPPLVERRLVAGAVMPLE